MAFRKTLEADQWDGKVEVTDAYWRLSKCRINRMLQDPNPDDPWDGEGEDPRTSYYSCFCMFTVFNGTPNKQGKPIASMTFEVPLTDIEAQEGDNLVAKAYALLASGTDFGEAEAI